MSLAENTKHCTKRKFGCSQKSYSVLPELLPNSKLLASTSIVASVINLVRHVDV